MRAVRRIAGQVVIGGIVLALAAPLFVVRDGEGRGAVAAGPPMLDPDGGTRPAGDAVEACHD